MGSDSCGVPLAGWYEENMVLKTGDALDNIIL